jgi:hypothetical protein
MSFFDRKNPIDRLDFYGAIRIAECPNCHRPAQIYVRWNNELVCRHCREEGEATGSQPPRVA